MDWREVSEVLDALELAGVRHWVVGGWGVDVLAGGQSREHRDLDLLTDAGGHELCMTALAGRGYAVETDWLPLRVEVAAAGNRWVDVHPVVFDDSGHGIQGDPEGRHYHYAPDAFSTASYEGRTVPCVGLVQQIGFHQGYAPREQDVHDLALLERLRDGG